MNDQLVEIKLHGVLAEQVGREVWNLAVSSVGEAVRALESQSKKLYKNLIKNDKKNIKYRVLINEKDFLYDEEKDINTQEGLNSSELVREYQDLRSIDIVPIVEGADAKDIFAIIAGIILIVLGVFTFGATTQMGMMLIAGGLGLMAAGIANLLTPMPEFGDFREIEGGGRASYIFSGPENTVREGGTVFIGYGRLVVGSQVIQSSIETFDVSNSNIMNTSDLVRNVGGGQHWGLENYGLDYRDSGGAGGFITKDKNDVFTTTRTASENLMRDRIAAWTTKTADQCPEGTAGVSKPKTFLRRDGDDYVTTQIDVAAESIDFAHPWPEYTSDGRTEGQKQYDGLSATYKKTLEFYFKDCDPEKDENGKIKRDANGIVLKYNNTTCFNRVKGEIETWLLEQLPKGDPEKP